MEVTEQAIKVYIALIHQVVGTSFYWQIVHSLAVMYIAWSEHDEVGYVVLYVNQGMHGVTVDYEEARKWYVKAAEQGLADAQNNLGCMYIKGDCLLIDYAEARKWFTNAAEQGLADSQYNLGKMYHLGKDVPIDYEIARKWYSKAIEQGSEEAKEGLRRITENE